MVATGRATATGGSGNEGIDILGCIELSEGNAIGTPGTEGSGAFVGTKLSSNEVSRSRGPGAGISSGAAGATGGGEVETDGAEDAGAVGDGGVETDGTGVGATGADAVGFR
jgi:hypothetical protein